MITKMTGTLSRCRHDEDEVRIEVGPFEYEIMVPEAVRRQIQMRVGQPVTFLCPTFAFLKRTEAATVLIHEALHYAGLPEQPSDPHALSPLAISSIVAGHCGF